MYILYDYYFDEYNDASNEEQETLQLRLAKLEEVITLFESHSNLIQDDNYIDGVEGEYSNYDYILGISPNCTCNFINYLLEVPCNNCEVYYDTQMAVTAILAGFNARGWTLAADLLSHSMSNTTLDSYYTPSELLVSRVIQSAQILDGVAYENDLTGGYAQDDPGWLNGVFANTLDGDIFNALGKFYYGKSYAGNDIENVSILDRYDYERGGDSPGGILINYMVTAQEIGILTPYYTQMNITVTGTASLSWQYTSTGVSITGSANNISQISIPNEFLDLRARSLILPSVNTNNITNGAFINHTQLTQVTIPSNVVFIGSNAFKNSNNASIIIADRASVPTTFDINWNSSGNPVYLNVNLCSHTSKTLIETNSSQHKYLCNNCRTVFAENHIFTTGSGTLFDHNPMCSVTDCGYIISLKCNDTVSIVSYNSSSHTYRCHGIIQSEPHVKYTSGVMQYCSSDGCNWSQSTHTHSYGAPYIPAGNAGGMSRHYSTCSCGTTVLKPCMGFAPEPDENAICALCGQVMQNGLILMELPDGTSIVTYDELSLFQIMVELSIDFDLKSLKEVEYPSEIYVYLSKEQDNFY